MQIDNKTPCESCGGWGHWELTECPRSYVGREMTEAINYAAMCDGGVWPIAGGLLDQSAWFVDVWSTLRNEQNRIDAMQQERWQQSRR